MADEINLRPRVWLPALAWRLRWAVVVLVLATVAAWQVADAFFRFLAAPAARALATLWRAPTLTVTTSGVELQLALFLGATVALPFFAWALWGQGVRGRARTGKTLLVLLTAATVIAFLVGAALGYTLSEPALVFLLSGNAACCDQVPPLTVNAVADFGIMMLVAGGLACALPMVLGLLGWLGVTSARALWRFERHALVLAVLAGAVLTPSTDIFSQLVLAAVLYLLYNLSIFLVWQIAPPRATGSRRPALPITS